MQAKEKEKVYSCKDGKCGAYFCKRCWDSGVWHRQLRRDNEAYAAKMQREK